MTTQGNVAFKDIDRETAIKRLVEADKQLSDLQEAMRPVSNQGVIIQEILKMKRSEAEFQTIVVNAFPPDRVSELFGTMSVALVGGGGVAYALSAGLLTAAVLWSFGAVCLTLTLFYRVRHQNEQMQLYRDRLLKL